MFHLVSSHKKRLQVRQSLFNYSQHEMTKNYNKMKKKMYTIRMLDSVFTSLGARSRPEAI